MRLTEIIVATMPHAFERSIHLPDVVMQHILAVETVDSGVVGKLPPVSREYLPPRVEQQVPLEEKEQIKDSLTTPRTLMLTTGRSRSGDRTMESRFCTREVKKALKVPFRLAERACL